MSGHHGAYRPLEIKAQLDHAVIDSDGHYTEFMPVLADRFIELAGELAGRRCATGWPRRRTCALAAVATGPVGQAFGAGKWASQTPEQRLDDWTPIPGWGPPHSHPLDRAVSLIPELRAERLAEIGIDFSVLYPSSALIFPHIEDAELRQTVCRALNIVNAEAFGPYAACMTPAFAIPMMNPEEAIAEVDTR